MAATVDDVIGDVTCQSATESSIASIQNENKKDVGRNSHVSLTTAVLLHLDSKYIYEES
jgi:hypothetical protein